MFPPVKQLDPVSPTFTVAAAIILISVGMALNTLGIVGSIGIEGNRHSIDSTGLPGTSFRMFTSNILVTGAEGTGVGGRSVGIEMTAGAGFGSVILMGAGTNGELMAEIHVGPIGSRDVAGFAIGIETDSLMVRIRGSIVIAQMAVHTVRYNSLMIKTGPLPGIGTGVAGFTGLGKPEIGIVDRVSGISIIT